MKKTNLLKKAHILTKARILKKAYIGKTKTLKKKYIYATFVDFVVNHLQSLQAYILAMNARLH